MRERESIRCRENHGDEWLDLYALGKAQEMLYPPTYLFVYSYEKSVNSDV